jgi:hypothetical protein
VDLVVVRVFVCLVPLVVREEEPNGRVAAGLHLDTAAWVDRAIFNVVPEVVIVARDPDDVRGDLGV